MNNDTISRQAAIEMLEANLTVYKRNAKYDKPHKRTVKVIDQLISGIKNLPHADSKIVECMVCKWNDTPECPMATIDYEEVCGVWETRWDWDNEPDDYCSYGERIE